MPKGKPRGNATTTGMGGMIASMQSYRRELAAKRDTIDRQLGALDGVLATLGQPAPARGPGRPAGSGGGTRGPRPGGAPRTGSLKDFILKVLGSGGEMAVKDIARGVVSAGFKTQNKTLGKSVGIALRSLSNVKKVGRGRFRLK